MGEEILKRNLEEAFAPPPDFPDPRLLSRTISALSGAVAPSRVQTRRRTGLRLPRVATQWAAAALVLVLALTAAAVFLVLRRPATPEKPIAAPVIFPTKMVSATTGWGVTSRGTAQQVWRTTDGGVSWTEVTPKSAADRNPYSYTNYFLDESNAWITEVASDGVSNPYLVTFRTTDGGKTWQRGSPVPTTFQSMIAEYFLDASSGWLVITSGDLSHATWPAVYVTEDGGLQWTLEASQAGADAAQGNLVPGGGEPSFVSSSTGWLTIGLYAGTGNGSFYFSRTAIVVTHDGGRTWRNQPLPIAPPAGAVVEAPVFFGQQGVIVMDAMDPSSPEKAKLFVTSDGGLTWSVRPLDLGYVESIQFVDAKHGWALAGPGSDFMKSPVARTIPLPLYRTDDGGVSWTRVATNLNFAEGPNRLTDIHFVDQRTGFATIWNDGGPTQVLRSDDGGQTWSVVARCHTSVGLSYPPAPCPAST